MGNFIKILSCYTIFPLTRIRLNPSSTRGEEKRKEVSPATFIVESLSLDGRGWG